ncbi:hypothetical protein N665_1967s0009 [Sinapis alba]|nr:hypothetical protein N665_1967s0009 [Sinapis alba]
MLHAIMLRVPFESLVECLSVCKKWRTTIRYEGFKEEYMRQSRRRLRLLFLYSEEPPERLFQSVSQEKPSLLSSKRQLRFKLEEDQFEMVSQPQQGLVCFSLENQFLLCNLGTKKCKPLPRPEGETRADVYFFGYDEVGDVFKLLRVSCVNVARMQMMPPSPPLVLTAEVKNKNIAAAAESCVSQTNNIDGNEGSWRPIEAQLPYTPVTDSVCINGVLYYGARSFADLNTYKVITFNLESEGFGLIDLPEGLQINQVVDRLVKYEGNVCLVKNGYGFELDDGTRGYEFFVKDENEEKLRPILLEIPRWRDVAKDMIFLFKGTSENGELVFATQSVMIDGSHYLLYYNADTQHLRKVKVEGGSHGDVETYLDHYDTLLLT